MGYPKKTNRQLTTDTWWLQVLGRLRFTCGGVYRTVICTFGCVLSIISRACVCNLCLGFWEQRPKVVFAVETAAAGVCVCVCPWPVCVFRQVKQIKLCFTSTRFSLEQVKTSSQFHWNPTLFPLNSGFSRFLWLRVSRFLLWVESFCFTITSAALYLRCCRSGRGHIVPFEGLLFLSASDSLAVSTPNPFLHQRLAA